MDGQQCFKPSGKSISSIFSRMRKLLFFRFDVIRSGSRSWDNLCWLCAHRFRDSMPVTLNYGMKMPSWWAFHNHVHLFSKFNVSLTTGTGLISNPWICQEKKMKRELKKPPKVVRIAAKFPWVENIYWTLFCYIILIAVRALIKKEQEEASIPANRIILGGFSMVQICISWF